jgi:hypothetical protein
MCTMCRFICNDSIDNTCHRSVDMCGMSIRILYDEVTALEWINVCDFNCVDIS